MSSIVIAQAVDPAEGLGDRADYTAIATVGLDMATRRFHILDVFRDRVDTTAQPAVVTAEYQKWAGPNFYRVGIETIFYQADLFRHLVIENLVPLKEIPRRSGTGSTSMNKFLRLVGLAGRYTRPGGTQILHPGRQDDGVWLPDYGNHPWLEAYEEELCAIGYVDGKEKHAHDDMADAVAMAVDMLAALLLGQYQAQKPRFIPVVIGSQTMTAAASTIP